jgi:hypothetical protein
MTKSARLALAVAVLALPVGASPIDGTKGPVEVHALPLARLHIKSFTIVSPACGKQADLRMEIQNLSGTPFVGSSALSGGMTYVIDVQAIGKPAPNVLRLLLPSVGGGATIPVLLGMPAFTTPCPSDTCWDVGLGRTGSNSGGPNFPEWDRKTARICAKTSCVHDPRVVAKAKKPCTFEIYSPLR